MDNIYNNSPYYTLANYYYSTLPEDYISPNSAAAQLGLTPADMAPILQEQYELMRDELAQPPPALTRPDTTNYGLEELRVIPNTYIHPESPAGQLGLTPQELDPILRDQQEFLRNELAQPPPILTRPTTTSYHHTTRIEATPNPVFHACPQQEAAELGIGPEELTAISEQATREQAEWLAKDETEWKNREEERWRGGRGADRENTGEEKGEETEETERREQREHGTRRVHTPTTTCPRSASPPFVHPELATAQLRPTPEEAK